MLLTGKIQCTFKTSNKEALQKIYKIMAVPLLLYIHGNWSLMKQLERRIETREITFLRSVAGCI
jgi:hypothetical protein